MSKDSDAKGSDLDWKVLDRTDDDDGYTVTWSVTSK
jgi:hypothetical protein